MRAVCGNSKGLIVEIEGNGVRIEYRLLSVRKLGECGLAARLTEYLREYGVGTEYTE
jgi:hypothetical protein